MSEDMGVIFISEALHRKIKRLSKIDAANRKKRKHAKYMRKWRAKQKGTQT